MNWISYNLQLDSRSATQRVMLTILETIIKVHEIANRTIIGTDNTILRYN